MQRIARQGAPRLQTNYEYRTISTLTRLRRLLSKSPRYVAERAWHEILSRAEKVRAPRRARRLSGARLAHLADAASVTDLWSRLATGPGPTAGVGVEALESLCPGDAASLIERAEAAVAHRVDLLGSGPTELGARIDWHRDFKTDISFAPAFCKEVRFAQLEQPSDVKVPWELSRMQWLIPAGQAYLLTGDERYAAAVRDALDDWISSNPIAFSVNWACTMDVALRAISWIWFFFAFSDSAAWRDDGFRERFLVALYSHGDFISRHLEKADINGNHYTADAAGLVFVGLFFDTTARGAGWAKDGWSILERELPRQVFADGVDFEASVPYHRLVQELFLYPALYRLRRGLSVDANYRDRLLAMARFTEAYSREDGSTPLWGDADDARTLPFRHDAINDHRYLIGLAGLAFGDEALIARHYGPRSEIAWLLGPEAAARLAEKRSSLPTSVAFPDGGFYVLRDVRNHVFIDCGPLGLAGRGGHGHNDLLSFEAMLDGTTLVSDCGAYLYTADYRERNNFRSTAYHNTPQIDGEEINRFVRPDYLWVLHDDALATAERFESSETTSTFSGSHDGYRRLPEPVLVRRTFVLDHAHCALTIVHDLSGRGGHLVEIPFHLAPGVEAVVSGVRKVGLRTPSRAFDLSWDQDGWGVELAKGRVSPSYGVAVQVDRILLRRRGELAPLTVTIG